MRVFPSASAASEEQGLGLNGLMPLLSVVFVAVIVWLLPGCGVIYDYEVASPPEHETAARAPREPTSPVAPPEEDEPSGPSPGRASAVIGPAGGAVALPSGASIEVPPGALGAPTTVTIEELADDVGPGTLGAIHKLTPEGTLFRVPVTVTLPFDASLAPEGAEVHLLTAPRRGESFTSLGGWVVEGGKVRGSTSHFSLFVAGSETYTTLAARETYPTALAVDGRQVYWANGGNAQFGLAADGGAFARDGGAPEGGRREWSAIMTVRLPEADAGAPDASLAQLEAGSPTALLPAAEDVRQMALDDRYVFATIGGHANDAGATGGRVLRTNRLGGARAVLASGLRFPTAIAVATSPSGAATHVVFSDWDTGRVARVGAGGGGYATLATDQGRVPYVVVAGGYAYWTSRELGTVSRRRVDLGGALEVLASGLIEPEGIALDDAFAYVTTRGAARGEGTLVRVPLAVAAGDAGAPSAEILWSSLDRPEQVVLAGEWLTFADSGARAILQLHTTTLGRRSRALGQGVPTQVAAVGPWVYWSNSGDDELRGGVLRLQAARCTAEECAAQGQFCSAATGACEATCPPASPSPRDVFVNPRSPAGGTGTPTCPVRTVTAGLAALAASTATGTKSAYLAQGVYGAASGESLPIVVRGVRLYGAGAAITAIEGTSSGALPSTLVVGDDALPTTVAKLAVRPAAGAPHGAGNGVRCERGVVRLEALAVGPSYAAGVVADCELTLVGSVVEQNAVGVSARSGSIAIGNGTPQGANRFVRSWTTTITGVAVDVGPAVVSASIRRNTFLDDDVGISILATAPPTSTIRIESNLLERQYVAGIRLRRAAVVDALTANTIRDVRAPGYLPWTGAGLLLDAESAPYPLTPRVRRARQNVFAGNDVGVRMRAQHGISDDPTLPPSDFGSPAEPGGNHFRCNSAPADRDPPPAPGFDVWIEGARVGATPLLFAGNAWDHATPTVASSGAARGTDLVAAAAWLAALDATGATVSTRTCPTDRAP